MSILLTNVSLNRYIDTFVDISTPLVFGKTSIQELLLLDHQDTNHEIDTEATEYIEPGRKKGNGKSEDAAIELKQQLYNPA